MYILFENICKNTLISYLNNLILYYTELQTGVFTITLHGPYL